MRTIQRSVPGNGRTVQCPVQRSTVRLHTLKLRHEGGVVASSRFNRNEVPAIAQRGEIEQFELLRLSYATLASFKIVLVLAIELQDAFFTC